MKFDFDNEESWMVIGGCLGAVAGTIYGFFHAGVGGALVGLVVGGLIGMVVGSFFLPVFYFVACLIGFAALIGGVGWLIQALWDVGKP